MVKPILSHMNSIRNSILLLAVLLVIGTMFYSSVEGWKVIDALYFSVCTITTVGYGDLHPTKDITKIFTMVYVMVGFGIVLYILTSLVTFLIELKNNKIERLEKKIIDLEKHT